MIGVVGISYKNAEVAFREKFSLCTSESAAMLAILLKQPSILSVVLLSTCNRTEIYFQFDDKTDSQDVSESIIRALYAFVSLEFNQQDNRFYTGFEQDCIRHLFQVASGLDSMVIGETQILGQLKDAYRLSVDNNASSSIMSRLFHKAFEVAKKVRTHISVNPVVLSAGSEAVCYVLPQLSDQAKVLIVGAGQMAETVVAELQNKGIQAITIYNRTEIRAIKMAQRFNCNYCTGNKLKEAITHSDLVFVATSALHPVVTYCMVNERTSTNRIFFDLAVPRNIEETVGDINGNIVFCIDDLKNIDNNAVNELFIAQANQYIDDMIVEFNAWLTSLKLSPTIDVISKKFSDVLEQRLSYLENKVSDSELMLLEDTGKYLKNKYLNLIVVAIKELSANGAESHKIDALNHVVDPSVIN